MSKSSSNPNFLQKIKARLTPEGRESLDPTPIAPPVGYKRQQSLSDQIREMVRSERLAQELAAQGFETFDEADDFDIGDDFDPQSPYEVDFDPPRVQELKQEAAAAASSRVPEGLAQPLTTPSQQAPASPPNPSEGLPAASS